MWCDKIMQDQMLLLLFRYCFQTGQHFNCAAFILLGRKAPAHQLLSPCPLNVLLWEYELKDLATQHGHPRLWGHQTLYLDTGVSTV